MYGYDSEIVGFEGPEKRLEIDFRPDPHGPRGLRALDRDQITELLDLARCSIVSSKSNEYFDSYVLSESSLFVYPFKLMIKTCGTTTLLNCIPKLMEFAASLNLSIELVMYSRKNFLFPHKQQYPHLAWSDEVEFLNKIFDGTSYVLGPLTQNHWYLYLADYSEHRGSLDAQELTMEVMMHELDPTAAAKFYRREGITDNTKFPGVADLLPGSETDEFNFTPCGYSMNGLSHEAYYTIHVTPEPHCSYASFETNVNLASYGKLVSAVCDLFKPGSFTVTLFNENGSTDHGYCRQESIHLHIPGYTMAHKTFCELEGCIDVTLYSFKAVNSAGKPKRIPPKLPLQLLNDEQS
jgi:S-adenosylmethionine decarboxylase